MKLIGGNISDTPVKNVGDGSAFTVGGAAGAPDLIAIGSVPAAGTALTNMDESLFHIQAQSQPYINKYTVKWSDNSFGCFWIAAASPYKLYYSHVTTNADGTFAACATKVDLSGDLTAAATDRAVGICGTKLSASRVVLHLSFEISGANHGLENVVYDKSSDTVAEHGTVFDHGTMTSNTDNSKQRMMCAAASVDQGIVFYNDAGTTSNISAVPVHFVGTKTKGTLQNRTASTNGYSTYGGLAFSDNSDPAIIFTVNAQHATERINTLLEWAWTAGTTPEIPSPYSTVHTGWNSPLPSGCSAETQTDGSFDSGGGMGVALINKNDIERGRFLCAKSAGKYFTEIGMWTGVDTDTSIHWDVAPGAVRGTDMGTRAAHDPGDPTGTIVSYGAKILEIDYDTDTFWGRYIYIDVLNGNDVFYTPFNLNWSTFQIVTSDLDDLPNATTGATISGGHQLRDVLVGSATATNMCTIYNDTASTADVMYLDVPFTA
mgnify:CR=1 FL=1|tara:strand:+ start:1249 stop:2715 length:1467 start_codon:yes stop_codon:yes gene_type:complete